MIYQTWFFLSDANVWQLKLLILLQKWQSNIYFASLNNCIWIIYHVHWQLELLSLCALSQTILWSHVCKYFAFESSLEKKRILESMMKHQRLFLMVMQIFDKYNCFYYCANDNELYGIQCKSFLIFPLPLH